MSDDGRYENLCTKLFLLLVPVSLENISWDLIDSSEAVEVLESANLYHEISRGSKRNNRLTDFAMNVTVACSRPTAMIISILCPHTTSCDFSFAQHGPAKTYKRAMYL
jgi:hypothetical protein